MKKPINTPSPSLTLPAALLLGLFASLASLPALAQNAHHGHQGHHGHAMLPAQHEPAHPAPAAKQDSHQGHEGHQGHKGHESHAAPPPQQTDAAHADTADGLRDPHAYAHGYVRGSGPYALTRYHLGDEHPYAMLLLDRLDWGKTASGQPNLQFDGQWSWGSSYNRLLLQSEGHAEQGKLQEARNEVLWSHAIAPFWDSQLGLRLDKNASADRQWLALGVQGLAPYWFEVHAKLYVGDGGRSALRLGGDYDLALSQKWFLQPAIESNFYGKSDAVNGLGSGLSSASVSLRLRYEGRRDLAPYLGVERQQTFGQTADWARSAGQKTGQTRWFAGLRIWF